MPAKPLKISDSTRLEMNRLLDEFQVLLQDIEKAEAARISGMDIARNRCEDCIDRIAQFKAQYFPGKK